MFSWIRKKLLPSQKIGAVLRAAVEDFRSRYEFEVRIVNSSIRVAIVPLDLDNDGVPDIDEIAES